MNVQGHTAAWQPENPNGTPGTEAAHTTTACAGECPEQRIQTAFAAWVSRCAAMSARAWSSILARIEARREAQRSRHLRLVETVSLGEKRFVAIVAVRGGEFLIGGGPGSVSLLARLEEKAELSPSCTQVSAAVAPDADALSWATSMPAGSPWRNQ